MHVHVHTHTHTHHVREQYGGRQPHHKFEMGQGSEPCVNKHAQRLISGAQQARGNMLPNLSFNAARNDSRAFSWSERTVCCGTSFDVCLLAPILASRSAGVRWGEVVVADASGEPCRDDSFLLRWTGVGQGWRMRSRRTFTGSRRLPRRLRRTRRVRPLKRDEIRELPWNVSGPYLSGVWWAREATDSSARSLTGVRVSSCTPRESSASMKLA